MESLRIIAIIKSNRENVVEVSEILKSLTEDSRKEEGNISYSLCEDVNDDSLFVVIEEWKSQEAIVFHNSTPHFKLFQHNIKDKTEYITIKVLKQVF